MNQVHESLRNPDRYRRLDPNMSLGTHQPPLPPAAALPARVHPNIGMLSPDVPYTNSTKYPFVTLEFPQAQAIPAHAVHFRPVTSNSNSVPPAPFSCASTTPQVSLFSMPHLLPWQQLLLQSQLQTQLQYNRPYLQSPPAAMGLPPPLPFPPAAAQPALPAVSHQTAAPAYGKAVRRAMQMPSHTQHIISCGRIDQSGQRVSLEYSAFFGKEVAVFSCAADPMSLRLYKASDLARRCDVSAARLSMFLLRRNNPSSWQRHHVHQADNFTNRYHHGIYVKKGEYFVTEQLCIDFAERVAQRKTRGPSKKKVKRKRPSHTTATPNDAKA